MRTYLDRTCRSLVVPVLIVRDPRTAIVQVLNLELVLGVQLSELLLYVRHHQRLDLVGRLGRHDTARYDRVLYIQSHNAGK